MLTLFRQTINVILPILISIIPVFICSKKKKTLTSKGSKESPVVATTKSQEKSGENGSKDTIDLKAPIIDKQSIDKTTDDEKKKASTPVVEDKKDEKQKNGNKKWSGEKTKKKSAKSEQETQKLELDQSKKTQKSNLKTAIIGSTMMSTVREPSKIVKVGTNGGGGGGGDGADDGGYEKLGDLSADELKKIADAAPA